MTLAIVDPIIRRSLVYRRASARMRRRVAALIAHMDAHPDATRLTDASLARLDDLLGEADGLRRALP